jgi:Glycosyltransferase family 87
VAQLGRRPLLAGALLGAAAAFKPTVLIMAPVALIAGGHWRALLAAGLAGLTVVAACSVAFGVTPWLAWFAAAPGYLTHITHDPRFQTSIVSPAGLAARLGLGGWTLSLWQFGFIALAVAMAAVVFRRTQALAPRLTALFGASLLASPYAMNYETTLLAPGVVLALMTAPDDRARLAGLAACVALAVAGLPGVAAPALLVFLALSLGAALISGARSQDGVAAALTPVVP